MLVWNARVRCLDSQGSEAEAPAAQTDSVTKALRSKSKSATADTGSETSSRRAQRKRSKKSTSSCKHLRQFVSSVTVDGHTFQVGDSAYLRMTEDFDEDDFAEEEVCQLCGYAEPADIAILECNKCLLGYHLTCLKPPLADVPKVSQELASFVATVGSTTHTCISLHYLLQLLQWSCMHAPQSKQSGKLWGLNVGDACHANTVPATAHCKRCRLSIPCTVLKAT